MIIIFIKKLLGFSLRVIHFINKNSKITGINVSRHGNSFQEDTFNFSANIFTDELISKINKPIKINCVIQNGLSIPNILERWSKISNCKLSLRADYTKITTSNLKDLNDDVISTLLLYCSYVSHGGCDVCFDVKFNYKDLNVSYHKGLEHSSIQIGNTILINDIVIKPNGDCYYDWDDKEIPDLLSNMIKYLSKKNSTKPTPRPNVNSNILGSNCFRNTSSINSCGISKNVCGNSSQMKSYNSCNISRNICGSSYNSCGGTVHCG